MKIRYLGAAFAACLMGLVSMGAGAAPTVIGMPNGTKVLVNSWDSLPYVWPNNSTELWGRVRSCAGACGTLTADWNFGDGTAALTAQAVSSKDNIHTTHTYTKTGSYTVTLTVHDSSDASNPGTATIKIDVVPSSATVKKALTIQRALKYLYMSQNPVVVTPSGGGSCTTSYWYSTSSENGDAATSFAVLALENFGHRASNAHTVDVYADTVDQGLNRMEYTLIYSATQNSRSNGYVYVRDNRYYSNAINAMAFISSLAQTRAASCAGDSTVHGYTYTDIVQKYVNLFADGANNQHAWHYTPGEDWGDGSSSPWVSLALHAAEDWGITGSPSVNQATLTSGVQSWVNCDQHSGGSFAYSNASCGSSAGNYGLTAGGIAEMTYAGGGGNKANALSYMGSNYCSSSNFGNFYSMYSAKKGLQLGGVTSLNTGSVCSGIDSSGNTYGGSSANWQTDYNNWLMANQKDNASNTGANANTHTNGVYWVDNSWFGNIPPFNAAVGALILASGLTNSPPQADAGTDQEIAKTADLSGDGSNSYHTDPTKAIVKYEWATSFDGSTFTAVQPNSCALYYTGLDGSGKAVTSTNAAAWLALADATKLIDCIKPTFTAPYSSDAVTTTHSLALRVTDNNPSPLIGIATSSVKSVVPPADPVHYNPLTYNIAPVANPGGPYVVTIGGSLTLDGSHSSDANSATANSACSPYTGMDRIVKYDWDLDGSGAYATHGGANPKLTIANVTSYIGSTSGQHSVGLRVTDTCGASAAQSSTLATVTVSNMAPVCYVPTVRTYSPVSKVYVQGYKMKLQNIGDNDAWGITAQLGSIPTSTGANHFTMVRYGDVAGATGKLTWANLSGGAGHVLQLHAGNQVNSDQDFQYSYVAPAPDLTTFNWNITYTDINGVGQQIRGVPKGTGICSN